MFTIKTFNTISKKGLNLFEPTRYHVDSADEHKTDAIILRSHQLQEDQINSQTKAIARAGAGTNNIPLEYASRLGIPVFNTPGANANAVKELVLAGLTLASRNICDAWHFVQSLDKQSEDFSHRIEQGKKQFKGFELPGRTFGVIGLGAIGVKVANTALALGMDVMGFDPKISVNRAWELSATVKQATSLESLLQHCQFVSIHVPLSDSTHHLLGHAQLALLQKNAVLLNFSRQALVDEHALAACLEEKQLHAYVSDFPNPRLLSHSQVISLPHLGASTLEAEDNCAVMAVKQVKSFLEDGNISNSVNFPSLELAQRSGHRLSISNANIPNMVAQISTRLAKHHLNIIDLLNKSCNDIAYSLIDVDAAIPEPLLTEIRQIDGVLNARSLL